MATEFFSPSWYRVERLKPRLRSHVRLHRHQYRGQIWYVLQDLASDKFHRFGPAAYAVIGLMDGRRTVQQIWEAANAQLGDEAPTQQDVVQLVSQLHAADALVCDIPPDTAELSRRSSRQAERKRLSSFLSLFAWRFPLCDPDRFLTRFLPVVRPLLGRIGAIVWLIVVGLGVLLGVMHWNDLTHDFFDQVLAPRNLFMLWLVFPVIKLAHELGHAFVTKAFGGEVHELGIMLLVFTPVPYVEASAAWAFRSKWQRILVGGAGMAVELFLATIALFVWLNAEPGLVRMIAYNAIVIAGVSTVLFNANPLLRFDGYYMLMDFLEIPNLKNRANQYFGYLTERYVLRQEQAETPDATGGERAWFLGYGAASALYRVLVIVGILLFLGDIFPLVAIGFAVLVAVTMIGMPLAKGVSFLVSNPRLREVRVRAVGTVVCLVMLCVAVLGFVPMPFHTVAEGVVWIPEQAFVRAETDGFVARVVAQAGTRVKAGEILFICRNPELSAQLRVLESRLKELQARRTEQEPSDRVKAAILEEEIRYVTEDLSRVRHKAEQLTVRSQSAGVFVAPRALDLPGRFVHQGELLGHVLELDKVTVRTVVAQGDIDLVRNRLEHAEARLAERLWDPMPAQLTRLVPAASDELPSLALSVEGGGKVPTDQTNKERLKSLQRFFQVDLTLPNDTQLVNAGGRVHVRFTHGRQPLAAQWSRQLRQLFLTRFNV
jgi:putative peptide zinc metalloprotease protein